MARELWIAGCLVLIFEGLVLAAIPQRWQRIMQEAAKLDPQRLRLAGIGAMLLGWLGLL
ncbi:MAG: DUF2065 domain-containing protein [Lysobacterales bacterium]